MIKITDGSVEREVTQGAFDNLYSKMGFSIVIDKVISKPEITKEAKKEDVKESPKDSKRSSK